MHTKKSHLATPKGTLCLVPAAWQGNYREAMEPPSSKVQGRRKRQDQQMWITVSVAAVWGQGQTRVCRAGSLLHNYMPDLIDP